MRVVVGLSGGVDSSVAAYLLKEQGHEVIGVFMQNWDPALNNDLADPYINAETCQAEDDFQDAKAVADKLGIEIHRVSFVQEYWDNVFLYFIEQYRIGKTPNPDIFCNKYIKFNAFMEYAFKNYDCDYIAMGHYARISNDEEISMLRGIDSNKDQTYFLEQLSIEMLEKTLFPVGDLPKSEVRKIASEQGLITADKKDSTGICFIGERNFSSFLSSYIDEKEGDIVDFNTKEIVGVHKGIINYTIGQRKGLGIGGNSKFDNQPWFVIGKNVEKNIVYVDQGEESELLLSNEAVICNINYLSENLDLIKTVKFRYRSDDVRITDYEWLPDDTLKIKYDTFSAVTPGQAAVFYDGERCLGGGEIDVVTFNGKVRAYEDSNTSIQ